MPKYVRVSGFMKDSKNMTFSLCNSKSDIQYNLRKAARSNDKETYVNMLRLKKFVNKASREFYVNGSTALSMTTEDWKNGPKYVIRENGRFKAVVSR